MRGGDPFGDYAPLLQIRMKAVMESLKPLEGTTRRRAGRVSPLGAIGLIIAAR